MESNDPALDKIKDLGSARGKLFTILNKPKIPLSPFTREETPTVFKTKIDELRYWSNETTKWREGVGDKSTGSYITGFYYFYMQECWLKDRYEGGGVFRPTYRLQDHLVTDQFEQSQKKGRHTIWFKGKGAGASGIAGAYLNYNMRVNPGTKGLYTSNSQDSIASFFTEKVMIPFNNFNKSIKPIEVQRSETAARVYLRAGINFIDQSTGNEKYDESILIMRETSQQPKSPKNLSGHGGKVLIIDEAMIHPRREAVIKSAIENLRNSGTGQYTGWALTCGTIEDDMTPEQLGGIYTMVIESEKYKFDMIFTPVWMIRNLVNGFPNRDKEIRAWEKELATKGKGTGAERSYRMINPISVTDILDVAKSGRWEGDVADIVKQHTEDMALKPAHEDRVKLVNMGDRIEKQPNPNGNVWILENPKAGVEYYYVFDGTVTGTETGAKEGSNYAGLIIKGFDPDSVTDPNCFSYCVVCIYYERPPNLEYAYRMAENQIRYYDQYKIMVGNKRKTGLVSIFGEANNNAESFISFMKKAGLVNLIGHRQDLYNKGNTDTNKLLQQVGDRERAWQYTQMNIYLRKHYKSVQMSLLIKDLNKPPGKGPECNADVLDAFLTWFFLFQGGAYDAVPKEKKIAAPRERLVFDRATGLRKWISY